MLLDNILQTFEKQYGSVPTLKVKAPGRINIIGDHTDYNMGFVLPAAIDRYTWFACGKDDSEQISVTSADYNQTFSISPGITAISATDWRKYVEAIVIILVERGYQIEGFNMVIGGNIPIGAGLSSSAALSCGVIFCINELLNLKINKEEIALLAQAAEVRIGLNCGLMDQYAVLYSKTSHCLFLDCQNLQFDFLPADFPGCSIVLINSNVTHHLAESEYNQRRSDVERILTLIKETFPDIESARNVDFDILRTLENTLEETGLRRLSFVLEENERVLDTCKALEAGDMKKVGQLMNASHMGLSTQYEVSCPELDFLAAFAQKQDYVLGSRMMGGGFGGCTINLVQKGFEELLIEKAKAAYKSRMNQDASALVVGIGEGVCTL